MDVACNTLVEAGLIRTSPAAGFAGRPRKSFLVNPKIHGGDRVKVRGADADHIQVRWHLLAHPTPILKAISGKSSGEIDAPRALVGAPSLVH